MQEFIISNAAALRINDINKSSNSNEMLKISVDGGGCNGLRYQFQFTQDKKKTDVLFQKNSAIVSIDEISLKYLIGSKLEYKNELGNAHFYIINPNTSSKCGCGESFSINT
ncbi:MAG: iron-sulfur cluster assembly accessory protein [Candidatus Midichloriaceae bacterium]|jgi:iron-sulfur cluster assembly accessory protein